MNNESRGTSSIPTVCGPEIKSYSLKKLAGGQVTVRDEEVGETFHPVIGAVTEARQLYVEQTFLKTCWKTPGAGEKTVWDVGLGAAANTLAVYESWAQGSYGDLYMESFDKGWGALRFALEHVKTHPDSLAYLEAWNWEQLMRQESLLIRSGGRTFSWRFHGGDFRSSCMRPGIKTPDLVMYDLYSAPKSPGLYSLGHWEKIKARMEGHPCLIVLHTRSTVVRVTMALAGWYLGRGTCLGEKEETTLAANGVGLLSQPLGREWLGKVRRSTSAFPLLDHETRTGLISTHWLEKLERHPQWAGRDL